MKKRILSAVLAATMALSLTACGGSNGNSNQGSDKSAADGGSKGTISVALWDDNQRPGLEQIAAEWSEESGYDVEFTVPGWDGYWTMLEAGVSGGEMPDVFWMHSNNSQKYMASGVLLNLDEYIAKNNIDMSNYFEDITGLFSLDGSVYGLPKDHDTIAVVYNKTIFDKYGVEYPTNDMTWEDFAAKAQEITDKGKADGVYGTYCNSNNTQDVWYNTIYAYGGEVISADKTASGYDNPATVEAMQFVVDKLIPASPSPDSMASTGGDTMFLSGLIGMVCQGSWTIRNFSDADNASDYAWVMMPYADVNGNGQCEKEERCTIYNGLGWSIYSGTDKADAAFDLIAYLTSKDAQLKQSELGVTMAGYKDCSESFAKAFGDMDVTPFVQIEEEGTLVVRPYSKSTATWEDDVNKALVEVWSEPAKFTEVLGNITNKMNETLAKEKK